MSLIGCHTLAGTGIEYPKKKPTWRYIKGDEKDFAHHAGNVNVTSIYITEDGDGFYGAVKEKEEMLDKRHTLLARRELVTNDNDDRVANDLRPRSIYKPDGTVQFGCIQTPLNGIDMVNHPSHYTQGGIECIDAIKAATVGKTGIEAVCVANVVKYLWRYEEKNSLEDVKKARWYLERLINELSEGE